MILRHFELQSSKLFCPPRNTPPMDSVMMKMNGTKPIIADRNHHNKPQYNQQQSQQQQFVNSQQNHQLNQQYSNAQPNQQYNSNAQPNQQYNSSAQLNQQYNSSAQLNQQYNAGAQYQVPIPQQNQQMMNSAHNANAQNQYYNTNSLTPDEKMSNLPHNIDSKFDIFLF